MRFYDIHKPIYMPLSGFKMTRLCISLTLRIHSQVGMVPMAPGHVLLIFLNHFYCPTGHRKSCLSFGSHFCIWVTRGVGGVVRRRTKKIVHQMRSPGTAYMPSTQGRHQQPYSVSHVDKCKLREPFQKKTRNRLSAERELAGSLEPCVLLPMGWMFWSKIFNFHISVSLS